MTQVFRCLSPVKTEKLPVDRGDPIHATLATFPSALALVDRAGETVLINEMITARYGGTVTVVPETVNRILMGLGGECRISLRSSLHDVPIEVHALAVALGDQYLLVVGDATTSPAADEVATLRDLVGRLELTASTDHLTGAWNRSHFDRHIAMEVARCAESKQPLSLVLFDIDHFKRINDRLGHLAGDNVLQAVVEVIRTQLRHADKLFRWGGEEFAVLFNDCGYRGAERRAQQIRRAVEEHEFVEVGRVTLSAGVAEVRNGETPSQWFQRIDKALYAAKARGRNRVVTDRLGNSDDWAGAGFAPRLHLQWSEAYECGETNIDDQHRELFALANAALDATLDPAEVQLLRIEQFICHVQQHFRDEEALLARIGYVDIEQHKKHHAGLIKAARHLRQRAIEGRCSLGDLVEFLGMQVVSGHLLVEDRKFFPLIQQSIATESVADMASAASIGIAARD